MKPVWLKEKAWIGAEGVADKIERWAGVHGDMPYVSGLEALLRRPEWAGSTVKLAGEFAELAHPSGAVARVRVHALEVQTCGRSKCKAPTSRCKKCDRRSCSHVIGGGGACSACHTPITYLHGANHP